MTQVGPYRCRIEESDSTDGFWRELHRQRRRRRVLPGIVVFFALAPTLAVALGALTPSRPEPAPYQRAAMLRVGDPVSKRWLVSLSRFIQLNPRVEEAWAPRRTPDDSPISPERVRKAVLARASELRECYERSESFLFLERGGTLVASMLIRTDGRVSVAVGGGDERVLTGVPACAERTLDRLRFPAQDEEFGWVHVPLRFEP
jgi:hypothetical protein